MTSKGIFTLAAIVSLVISVGATSCKELRTEGLQLVGKGRPETKQSPPKGLVIVTHGWIEKGSGDWPEDMAGKIYEQIDDNTWRCGYFDWSAGAKTLNPTDAARYARDIAGPRLAGQILNLGGNRQHIHLLGHSCGCWAVSEAAKILAEKTQADLHLTFFDAYVPEGWDQKRLGDVKRTADVNCWVEQYYTRDLTLTWTQQDLSFAHNVDITILDGVFRDHNFPWQWYLGTISESHPQSKLCNSNKTEAAYRIEYGFALSRESAGPAGWRKTLKLPVGNTAIKLKKHQQ